MTSRPGGRGAPGWLSSSPTQRLRLLSPPNCPDKLRSRNSRDERRADLSITLACRYIYQERSGRCRLLKPHCIVYIIHLPRTDKEKFGWPGPELKHSSGRTDGADVLPGKRPRRVTYDCSTSQHIFLWSGALTAHPSMRLLKRRASASRPSMRVTTTNGIFSQLYCAKGFETGWLPYRRRLSPRPPKPSPKASRRLCMSLAAI